MKGNLQLEKSQNLLELLILLNLRSMLVYALLLTSTIPNSFHILPSSAFVSHWIGLEGASLHWGLGVRSNRCAPPLYFLMDRHNHQCTDQKCKMS